MMAPEFMFGSHFAYMEEMMKKPCLYLWQILAVICTVFLLNGTTQVFAESEEITILYTNDIHTYIDGGTGEENIGWDYAKVAALKEQYEHVLLIDAGDHIQGTAYGGMDDGKMVTTLMKAAGYDLATLGNHEFDYGMLTALDTILNRGISYVSCNFYSEENGVRKENVVDSYKIFEIAGKKVAFVGITTPESFTKSSPAYFQDENGNYIYGISGGSDGEALYKDVQNAIDLAREEGADYVIALGHLGVDPSSSPWRSTDVIAHTSGLDAFIDGHSHTTVVGDVIKDLDGNEVILTQTGSYFDKVGVLTITENGIFTELLGEEISAVCEKDAEVEVLEDGWISEIHGQLGQVIGYADVVLDNYDSDGNRLVRMQETNTGDFCTDALYHVFNQMGLDVDVAVMNGGGIRNGALTGPLSYLSCKEIHTFGNVACLLQITGQQLLDALEWGIRDLNTEGTAEAGSFLHVSGVTYEIHRYIESTVVADEKGVWLGGPTGEYRVKNVMIYDKDTNQYVPLDLNATYNIAGYNYTLRDLGGGFAMFENAVNVLDYVMEDHMVLAEYMKSFPVSPETGLPTITAENSVYGDVNGEGRIKVLTESPEAVDTGDDTKVFVWLAAMAMSFTGISLILKKKTNQYDE